MLSEFGQRLIAVTLEEFDDFGGLHETDQLLRDRIYETYLAELKRANPGDVLGWAVPDEITEWKWSAVFVSWCLLTAGATNSEFDFSIRHAKFIRKAIANATAGAFRGRRIEDYAPKPGDLICANADGGRIAFNEAAQRDEYSSHSAIVVEVSASRATTIGGNEDDMIDKRQVPLIAGGLIKQRAQAPFICVIENRKQTAPSLARVPER